MILVGSEPGYIIGVDPGQAQDPTGIVAVEMRGPRPARYAVRAIERPPLGTAYHDVVGRGLALLQLPAVARRPRALVVDETGVGRPVVEMFRRVVAEHHPEEVGRPAVGAVSITSGRDVMRDAKMVDRYTVPKRDLVGAVQVVLQGRRIAIAQDLALTEMLVREVRNFRVKIKGEHDTYEAWRESDHDDLLLALAVAIWWGERVVTCIKQRPKHLVSQQRIDLRV